MIEQIINLDAMEQALNLFGSFDENIKIIEKEIDVSIIDVYKRQCRLCSRNRS